MKLDADLGTEGNYLRRAGESARAADALGFAGLWTYETKHDAFLPLAIAANETQRIQLGTSVAIAFSRSPLEVAQTAWDLQDLSDGRFILGLGTQVWLEAVAGRYRNRMTEAGPIIGLHKLLEEARARGLRRALVTDTPEELARKSLEALGLTDAFEPMVFAEEMGVEKPDPTPYKAALERLGISPEEALAFEDSPKGVKAAVRAGIPVVGLISTHKPDELREAGAEFVVGDFADQALRERLDG